MNANVPSGPQGPRMKIVVELDVDPLGLTPKQAERIVAQHLPNYIVDGGLTVQIEGAKILRVTT